LSIFYIIFVATDIIFLSIADWGLPIEENFECARTSILMSSSESGAYFLFFYGLSIQFFSLMIWCVFYKVPEKFGLLRKLASGPRMDLGQEDTLQIETEDFDQ